MDWFTLTLILSLIASSLILSMRAITPTTNPFAFMAIVVGVASVSLAGFCFYKGTSLQLPSGVLPVAIMAGIAVSILDVAFILMFRAGAKISISMPLFGVAGILLSVLIGCAFLHETVTLMKFIGILLACMAVYFLTTSSPEKGDA